MPRCLLLAFVYCLLVCGCSAHEPAATHGTDETHRRIVSLMPSLTEGLFAIGAGPQVVGVSTYTTYPPQARRLPVVASYNSIDAERIVAMHADLVVGIVAQAQLLQAMKATGIASVTFADDSYADIFTVLQGLGVLSGRIESAQTLVQRLQKETAALHARARFGRPPRCFVVLNVNPIYTVGSRSFIATLIELAGGRNAARLDTPYAQYSPEALLAADPDVIVTDRLAGLSKVLDRAPWRLLRAVRNHHVFVEPDHFNVPGPRYNESLAWLIEKFKTVQ